MLTDRRYLLAASASRADRGRRCNGTSLACAYRTNSAEGSWSAAPAARSADPRIRAMAYAVLAPNALNLQPWLAELPGDDTMVLRCDLTRRLPAADAEDRMTVIGFGNFLELLRIAAAQDGYEAVASPFPEGEPHPALDGRPIAAIRFTKGGAVSPTPCSRRR